MDRMNSTYDVEKAVDARYEEVKEKKKTDVSNVPAEIWEASRHPLAETGALKDADYATKAKDDLALYQELGLKNQAKITSARRAPEGHRRTHPLERLL